LGRSYPAIADILGMLVQTRSGGQLLKKLLDSKPCHALPATAARHGTPENVPLGATHAVPSQILWIQFGYGCNAPTSHTIDFWRMGQVEANTEEVTLDIPQHYHQIT